MANNAKLTDPTLLIQAGIDPKTGLPLKLGSVDTPLPKENIRKQLRVLDEQDAVNTFTWYNLPPGLNSALIERILYYRGQGAFFKLKDKFYFLPYALSPTSGTGIDVYGRFTEITPLPFNGTSGGNKGEEMPWIRGLTYKPLYDVLTVDEIDELTEEAAVDMMENSCVLLKDYTPQYSETIISRQVLNDPLLDTMSDCLPFMRTALINSTGVLGMRVGTENEYSSVYQASNAINRAALTGQKYVPIVGDIDFQELTGGNTLKAEEFLIALQAMDNYRLSLHGLDNGGLFQKKSHMLEAEQKMNAGTTGLVLRDRLLRRQEMCMIANTVWGLGMWVEPSEPVVGMDTNGDGMATNGTMIEEKEETVDVQSGE